MPEPDDVNRLVGDHLRRLRKQKGLSLLDVEAASRKEFKASVLGAYERGERAISAARLARLADLYRVPMQAMLPPNGQAPSEGTPGIALDLERLDQSQTPEGQTVARFVRLIQAQRREWSDRVVRIRSDDIRALASAVDRTPTDLLALLDELKVRAF
jgi:transcriptional regulator with XRE-family HTH domain